MSISKITTVCTVLPVALLTFSAEVRAQASDVDCNKCVDTADLRRGAITSGKIGAGEVSSGKLADESVTRDKIDKGAVSLSKVVSKLKNDIGTFCEPGMVVVGKDSSGHFVCEPSGGSAATCDEMLFTGTVWGTAAAGFDMRERTFSTFHFLGCAGSGCVAENFYCAYDADSETLAFGSSVDNKLRAMVDPGDVLGDIMDVGKFTGCCSDAEPNQVCNAPDSTGNDSGVDQAVALCNILGYKHGTIVSESEVNNCPEINATAESGQRWTTDYVATSGYGREYLCRGFQ